MNGTRVPPKLMLSRDLKISLLVKLFKFLERILFLLVLFIFLSAKINPVKAWTPNTTGFVYYGDYGPGYEEGSVWIKWTNDQTPAKWRYEMSYEQDLLDPVDDYKAGRFYFQGWDQYWRYLGDSDDQYHLRDLAAEDYARNLYSPGITCNSSCDNFEMARCSDMVQAAEANQVIDPQYTGQTSNKTYAQCIPGSGVTCPNYINGSNCDAFNFNPGTGFGCNHSHTICPQTPNYYPPGEWHYVDPNGIWDPAGVWNTTTECMIWSLPGNNNDTILNDIGDFVYLPEDVTPTIAEPTPTVTTLTPTVSTPTPTVSTPTPTVSTPTPTVSTPTPTVSTPTPTVSTPTPTVSTPTPTVSTPTPTVSTPTPTVSTPTPTVSTPTPTVSTPTPTITPTVSTPTPTVSTPTPTITPTVSTPTVSTPTPTVRTPTPTVSTPTPTVSTPTPSVSTPTPTVSTPTPTIFTPTPTVSTPTPTVSTPTPTVSTPTPTISTPTPSISLPTPTNTLEETPTPTLLPPPRGDHQSSCDYLKVISGNDSLAPETVTFKAAGSDNLGDIQKYKFYFGDESANNKEETDSQYISHRYEKAGRYTVKVKIKDSVGNWKESEDCTTHVTLFDSSIKTGASCDQLSIDLSNNAIAPSTATLIVHGTDISGGIKGYKVVFNDNTELEGENNTFTKIYDTAGSYSVKAYVKDIHGNWLGGEDKCKQIVYINSSDNKLTVQPETGAGTMFSVIGVLSGIFGFVPKILRRIKKKLQIK